MRLFLTALLARALGARASFAQDQSPNGVKTL